MNPSLAAIDHRLDRAQQHIDLMHAEIARAFIEGKTYDVSHECAVDTHEHAFWLNVYEPHDPIRWGVLVGDVVHQSRAALDNLAYQLSLLTTQGADVKGTSFPILTDPRRWDEVYGPRSSRAGQFTYRSAEHKLRKVPSTARDRIKALQPFNGMCEMNAFSERLQTDDRIRRSLHVLERFWNADKHRVPATTATAGFISPPGTSGVAFRGQTILAGTAINFGYKLPFAHRTKLVWWAPTRTDRNVPVDGEFRPFVLFDPDGPGDDQSVRGTLATCLADVQAVVDGFRPLFS